MLSFNDFQFISYALLYMMRIDKIKNFQAGTAGFRAPELLLKYRQRTTLIDIWSAGIIFLSLLCRKHPVMRPDDDYEAIAQIAVIFGSEPIEQLAQKNNSTLLASWNFPGLDIVKFVNVIRNGSYFMT